MLSKMYYTPEAKILSQAYQMFIFNLSAKGANALRGKEKSWEVLDYINSIRSFMVTQGLPLQKANRVLREWGI